MLRNHCRGSNKRCRAVGTGLSETTYFNVGGVVAYLHMLLCTISAASDEQMIIFYSTMHLLGEPTKLRYQYKSVVIVTSNVTDTRGSRSKSGCAANRALPTFPVF